MKIYIWNLIVVFTLAFPSPVLAQNISEGQNEPPSRQSERNYKSPKNIILFIGDGLGREQIKAARLFSGRQLSFERFPYSSEATTYSASSDITDSAAAATAMATGTKVDNGVLSMELPGEGSELTTILEQFSSEGKFTGLVSTAFITHATPAAFAAHEPSRSNYYEIAHDYLEQTLPDVLLGGGGEGMTISAAENVGYHVVEDLLSLLSADYPNIARLSGQFGLGHMPYESEGLDSLPHLSDMTAAALDFCSSEQDRGFFLMVEGARIDHAGHENSLENVVLETLEFSASIDLAVSWARSRIDTLIIVTADHETGGLEVLADSGPGELPEVSWSTTGHTAAAVPVYAWGFGAEAVNSVFDNTDIYHLIQNAGAIYQTDRPTACDFNGDGMSDYAVVRSDSASSTAYLFIRYTNSGGSPGDFAQVVHLDSGSTDTLVHGDFDGDRFADVGLFRETQSGISWWHNRHSSTLQTESTVWGVTGDIPVTTDIDGDGRGDRTVFRGSDGSWWSARTALGPIQLSWGLPGDLPVSADFDRDGWDDIAVWRPSSGYWAVLQSSLGASSAPDDVIWRQWGLPGDHPMPGDFDGDGKADLAVWRPGNGTWYVCSSLNRFDCSEGRAVQFGLPGDFPIHGDFDGDGILDFVVWRENTGMWFVRRSSDNEVLQVQWGLSGDIPLCQGVESLLNR